MGLSLDVDHARDSQYRNALFQSKHTGDSTEAIKELTVNSFNLNSPQGLMISLMRATQRIDHFEHCEKEFQGQVEFSDAVAMRTP